MMMRILHLLILALIVAILAGRAGAEDGLKGVHYNMKASDVLSPEYPPEGKDDDTKVVQAEVTQIGPILYNPQWVDGGKWTSTQLRGDLKLGTEVRFNVWARFANHDGDQDTWFRFNFFIDDTVVAKTDDVQVTLNGEPKEVVATATLNTSTPALSGHTIAMNISIKSFFDVQLLFDSREHLSGAQVDSDPVVIYDLQGSKNDVVLIYDEKFGAQLNFKLVVDDVVIQERPEKVETNQGKGLKWPVSMGKGDHNVVCDISYGPLDGGNNTTATWEVVRTITIKEESKSGILGFSLPGFEAPVIAISAAGAYMLMRRKR